MTQTHDVSAQPKPTADGDTLLEVRSMTRRFGGLMAVNNVSFEVWRREIFGLIGPNGAGKTTLFNLMTGLTPPTSGTLIYQGVNITKLRPHRIAAHGIARTFQNIGWFGDLTALQNVMIAQHVHTRTGVLAGVFGLPPSPQEERAIRTRAHELLELVGLDNRAHHKARSFAYGDQRRLEIARALALKPKLLLLDEPAAGMNTNEKYGLTDFIPTTPDHFDL